MTQQNTGAENQSDQESFSFVESEKSILKFWQENQIFEKSLAKTKDNSPYIFYDGPPFATGLPHHGHLVASTIKDIIPRYFTMKGRYVSRRFGWDCHGLPIEQQIDKKFGMSANDYVAKNGIKAYCDACREIVLTYTSQWEKTISRLGRWVDFENDYKTMDLDFMESVWWVFKQAWDKGLIYEGNKVVPYSVALQTGLSNFEATSNYQDVQDPAITVLFKIKDSNEYLSAWTTTPWTLPSNMALIVNKEIDYLLVHEKTRDIKMYIAEARLEAYQKGNEFEVLKTVKGSDLIGLHYEPLFDYFMDQKENGAFQVVSDDYVTTSDGTGIVHSAPAFGEDDNRVLKEHNISAFALPLNSKAEFTDEVRDFKGQYIKDADKNITKHLKDKGLLFHQSVLVHSYPFCYRTDTPLIYMAMPQWYLNVDKIKEDILAANQEIYWVPGHIKEGRFGKWLEGARDWAISRKRFWGTPLPVWKNEETGSFIAIGSVEELFELSGTKVTDLHREIVDEISFSKEGEPGVYKRVSDVFDCWFESGSMPYAQIHYPFENQEIFKEGFPAEFIAEGLDQTRGWFYTLTVLSAALYQKPAFKNVIVNGMVMAGDGKKMSKRLKNYTEPDIIMENFGADALRLTLINSGLVKGEELRFTDDGVKDMVRRALLPWYNSFKFFHTYASVDGWKADQNFELGDNVLDRWLISKLQTLTASVTREMDGYKLYNVVPQLFSYIEDLTNWYIRLNRRRFWEDKLTQDKCQAYSALYTSLLEMSKIMAPFAPYLSEHIFLELKAFGQNLPESVHLTDYPSANENLRDENLEDAVIRMQELILLGRQKRNQVQIKVKTPCQSLQIIHQDRSRLDGLKVLEDYIKTELNVKDINYSEDEDKYINLFAKPNSRVLGKRLGKKFGPMMGKIKALKTQDLKDFEEKGEMSLDGENLSSEDIFVFREPKEGSSALSNRWITIDLDTNLSEELIQEGLAREVVNRIQRSRKDLGFNVDDRIKVQFTGDSKIVKVIEHHSEYIMAETLTMTLEQGSDFKEKDLSFDIEGENLRMRIEKTS
ncbi:MAG: isoleucine--tRNA ligase [Halobacteriovoraceae bacterium]|nr:isoleucine--tRNA ligase [Halobacteriovoraceae bacterium]|tara:strand:+ start:4918 stop:8067 length:3150 start_codon:yes stop_codon:yes gene_type:complete